MRARDRLWILMIVFISMFFLNSICAFEFGKPEVVGVITDNTAWQVRVVRDFNNDSIPDLLFQHPVTGKLSILFMNSDGTKNDSVIISDANLVWKMKAVEDADKDGVADIIWQNSVNGKVALWIMNSNGTTKTKSSVMGNTVWTINNMADFNNDSIPDLLFQHPVTGKLSILFMNSDGTKNSTIIIPKVSFVWKIKAVDDLDKDGVADIIWQHTVTGRVVAWIMNSNGTQKSNSNIIDSTAWQVRAVKDFNNDSVSDLVFQNPAGGEMVVWLMNSDGTKNSTLIIPKINSILKMRSMMVFNNDNIPDIIWQHAIDGKVSIWFMSYNNTILQENTSICTYFNYTEWSECVNENKVRTIVSSFPENCTGGDPEISQDCVSFVSQLLNETNISEEEGQINNETNIIDADLDAEVNETNNTVVPDVGLTCEQIGLSLNFLPENILCICPSCEVQSPTICARMGFFDLQNSSDCTYCCGRTS